VLATLGIAYQQLFHEKYKVQYVKKFSTGVYFVGILFNALVSVAGTRDLFLRGDSLASFSSRLGNGEWYRTEFSSIQILQENLSFHVKRICSKISCRCSIYLFIFISV
jgi:hypothetical protein